MPFLALLKWRLQTVSASKLSLRAAIAASLHNPANSAPVKHSVFSATSSRSTSSESCICLVWTCRTSSLLSKSGGGTYRTCSSHKKCEYSKLFFTQSLTYLCAHMFASSQAESNEDTKIMKRNLLYHSLQYRSIFKCTDLIKLCSDTDVLTESKRPGRIRAASIACGRLVAANTSTPWSHIPPPYHRH